MHEQLPWPESNFCLKRVPHASAQVTAGTVNYEGPVTVRATSTGADATLAGIARLVADAQVRRHRHQTFLRYRA